jgi:hypothetical protein
MPDLELSNDQDRQVYIDDRASHVQAAVNKYLEIIPEIEWQGMWGEFSHETAKEMVLSPHGWKADHDLADQLVMFVAKAMSHELGEVFGIDIFDDDSRAVRRVGSPLDPPHATVLQLVLRNQHYRAAGGATQSSGTRSTDARAGATESSRSTDAAAGATESSRSTDATAGATETSETRSTDATAGATESSRSAVKTVNGIVKRPYYLIDADVDQTLFKQLPMYNGSTIIKGLNQGSPLQDYEPQGFACVTLEKEALSDMLELIQVIWKLEPNSSIDWGHESWQSTRLRKVLFEVAGWRAQPEMGGMYEVNTSKAEDQTNGNQERMTLLDSRRTKVQQLDAPHNTAMQQVLAWIISGVPEDAKKAVPDYDTVVWTGSINVGTCNVIPHVDEDDADGPGFHYYSLTLQTLRTQ